MSKHRRLGFIAAALLLALSTAWFEWSRQQQKQLLIEMESHRQKTEQVLDAVDWQDRLLIVLEDWKKVASRLNNKTLRKTLLGEILAMEQKSKMLARPGIRNSLDTVARALAEANDRNGPGTNTVTK